MCDIQISNNKKLPFTLWFFIKTTKFTVKYFTNKLCLNWCPLTHKSSSKTEQTELVTNVGHKLSPGHLLLLYDLRIRAMAGTEDWHRLRRMRESDARCRAMPGHQPLSGREPGPAWHQGGTDMSPSITQHHHHAHLHPYLPSYPYQPHLPLYQHP